MLALPSGSAQVEVSSFPRKRVLGGQTRASIQHTVGYDTKGCSFVSLAGVGAPEAKAKDSNRCVGHQRAMDAEF